MPHLKNIFFITFLLIPNSSQTMLIKRLTPNTRHGAVQTIRPINRSCSSYKNYLNPGLEALKKASDGKSIIFQECKQNPTQASQYLNQIISDSIKHYERSNAIQRLESYRHRHHHALGNHLIAERFEKEKESYPFYRKDFLETLSGDEKRQLEAALTELVKNVSNDKLPSEAHYLERASKGLVHADK